MPLNGCSHVVTLGSEPADLTVSHAAGEDPGVRFWAEPGV